MKMKKIIVSVLAAVLTIGAASAQEPVLSGRVESKRFIALGEPSSVVRVTMVVRKESVRSGPYARYCNKLLGVIPPVSDKDIYSVANVTVSLGDASATPLKAQGLGVVSHIMSDTSFVKIPSDRTDSKVRSQEEMANLAAARIFTLRKVKYDLVSGYAGENVFGAGLADAIKRLDDMEQECLALFLGKQFVTEEVYTFDIVPQKGKNSYTVCVIADGEGVLPASASGTKIVLELASQTNIGNQSFAMSGKNTNVYRMPDMVRCTVKEGGRELGSAVIPVYQWGVDVEM